MRLLPNRHRPILLAWLIVLLGLFFPKGISATKPVPWVAWWAPIPASGSGFPYLSYLPSVFWAVPMPISNEESTFVQSIKNGQADVIQGVYSPNAFELQVVQQPFGDTDFVNMTPGTATQFRSAADHGVTGLLADNASSGTEYYKLQIGNLVDVVYGDGEVKRYVVDHIEKYQAIDPYNPYGDFVDLSNGASLSAGQLFNRVYTGGDHVTLQTCIANQGVPAWGRMFIVAFPQY